MSAPSRRRVSFPKAELDRDGRKVVRVGRREILVVDDRGTPRALFNRCPHRQATLTAGPLRSARPPAGVGGMAYDRERQVLLCPWHRYEFDLESGRCPADPQRLRVATYEVHVEGDEIAVYA
jgi:nitrite reductase/ring-hydroxylating ferredoxin subunit